MTAGSGGDDLEGLEYVDPEEIEVVNLTGRQQHSTEMALRKSRFRNSTVC